ncbi:hypothetical protein F5Y14DRAFT_23933 [Nemania sp. NC0429]|nr:hypothetical protein F5Y14DRAFT_23933 [Nemania sp. NC0429]
MPGGGRTAAGEKNEVGEMDMRPESSPYASPLITIHFAGGPPLTVPTRLIDKKSPKLSSGCGYNMTLRLAHISSDAGHVLVHYLFTGAYECLKPKGSSPYEKNAAEFATSVRAYTIARQYELPDLEGLARAEIEKLGNRLEVMKILDVLRDTLPNPGADDTWIQKYLETLVRSFINSPPASLRSPSGSPDGTLPLANALLRVFADLWHEKTHSPSPSRSDLDLSASQVHRSEPVAGQAETGPANGSSEQNPTSLIESVPGQEDADATPQRTKKGKKKKKTIITLTEEGSGMEGKEQTEVQDGGGDLVISATISAAGPEASWPGLTSKTQSHWGNWAQQTNSTVDILTRSEPLEAIVPEVDDVPPPTGTEYVFEGFGARTKF